MIKWTPFRTHYSLLIITGLGLKMPWWGSCSLRTGQSFSEMEWKQSPHLEHKPNNKGLLTSGGGRVSKTVFTSWGKRWSNTSTWKFRPHPDGLQGKSRCYFLRKATWFNVGIKMLHVFYKSVCSVKYNLLYDRPLGQQPRSQSAIVLRRCCTSDWK